MSGRPRNKPRADTLTPDQRAAVRELRSAPNSELPATRFTQSTILELLQRKLVTIGWGMVRLVPEPPT